MYRHTGGLEMLSICCVVLLLYAFHFLVVEIKKEAMK